MNKYINDFPFFLQKNKNGLPIAYLDNAATTQKPQVVLDAVRKYYKSSNANPHSGSYDLSVQATQAFDSAREKVKSFIGAKKDNEIIFTKSATEALNIVAQCYGMIYLNEGDNIVIAISEHHSNMVPWQMVAKSRKAELRFLYTDQFGRILPEEIKNKITERTKLVAVAHASNVTGNINPVEMIIEESHRSGAVVVVDGTQGAPHIPVDVSRMDADFYVFSGHKMLAPMGIGVLYGKESLLQSMPPFLYGGDMIEYVEEDNVSFAPLPQKFEGGTQNVGGAVGLAAAIDYLNKTGMGKIAIKEQELTSYLLERLKKTPHLKLVGSLDTEDRIGVTSFIIEDVHPHDIATILNADGIAVRSGSHCAHPFHNRLGLSSTCRASTYLYNTTEDIDRLWESLKGVRRWLGYGT